MILKAHLQGGPCYDVGDEVWQESLIDAIMCEAEMIAEYAAGDLCWSLGQADRDAMRNRIVAEMTVALRRAGDRYTAPDPVVYSLLDELPADPRTARGTVSAMTHPARDPVVEEVLRFENLPAGSGGTRRAIVRWSHGSEGPALSWYADEVLSRVGHVGRQ